MKKKHGRRFNFTIDKDGKEFSMPKIRTPKGKPKPKPKPKFHPRAPIRLKRLWKDYPAYYRIAKYLNVNPAEVWNALTKGKEPVNENVRVKFGLPRKPRKPRTPHAKEKTSLPAYIKWWRRLSAEMRNVYIQETYHAQL